MKYIAIVDENNLKEILERGAEVKPIAKTMFVNTDGKSVYISQGHIDVMVEYEQKQQIESIQKDLAEMWQQSTS